LNRVYNWNWPNPGDEFCCAPAVDCWDDIVIRVDSDSSLEKELGKFVDTYKNDGLVTYFSESNWKELFPYMTEDIKLGIIENRFIVSVGEDSKQKNTIIVVVRGLDENVLAAYPLSTLSR